MALPVYPGANLLPGLTYGAKWSPVFFNQTATGPTGAEQDIAIAQYPLHDFELTYEFLRDGPQWGGTLSALELRTMMGFHLQMSGSLGRFLYKNPDDQQVFQQPIGIGDGTTQSFTLVRTFGANGYGGFEPVGQVNTGELFNVYLGGSFVPVAPTLYTLNTANAAANTITFTTAPAAGQAVAIDMSYFYYCKLANNTATFEKFMHRLWSIGKVQFRSCRPGT